MYVLIENGKINQFSLSKKLKLLKNDFTSDYSSLINNSEKNPTLFLPLSTRLLDYYENNFDQMNIT